MCVIWVFCGGLGGCWKGDVVFGGSHMFLWFSEVPWVFHESSMPFLDTFFQGFPYSYVSLCGDLSYLSSLILFNALIEGTFIEGNFIEGMTFWICSQLCNPLVGAARPKV